jgi:predicted PurR-regulated permease PerM
MLMFALLIVSSAAFFAYQQADDLVSDDEKMQQYNHLLDSKWSNIKQMPIVGPVIIDAVGGPDSNLGSDLSQMGLLSDNQQLSDVLVGMMSSTGSILTTSLTVTFFLIFIIFEASLLPDRIERAWPGGANEKVQMMRDQIESGVNTYIVVKTGVGIGTAVIAGIIMAIFGIDLWFTWALLTFLLNYVPYIGSLFATVPPIVLGLILLSPGSLILLIVLLLTNQQMWGNVIETRWAGRALDLSPVVLLLVTAFSFWLWGILGMILAVPFAVIIKIVLENIEETRPIAILLSERAPTIDEAWKSALKDGKISLYETKTLKELQTALGLTDKQVVLKSSRFSAEHVLQYGKVSKDQKKLILQGAKETMDSSQYNELKESLIEGKINPHSQEILEQLIALVEEE